MILNRKSTNMDHKIRFILLVIYVFELTKLNIKLCER